MIRCLIVDDEMPAREELKFLLEDLEEVEVVGEADDGFAAIERAEELSPDVVFLDIKMRALSGIRVAEKFLFWEQPPLVIFTTAYDDYAIKAFELNAIDYLMKPISSERLVRALQKIGLEEPADYLRRTRQLVDQVREDQKYDMDRLYLEKEGTYYPLPVEEITYVSIVDKHTTIHSRKGLFTYAYPLNHLEKKLPQKLFFRSHRGFLLNLTFIEAVEPWFNNTYLVKLRGEEEKVPVARSQVKAFKELLGLK